jgi:hypothetical protein
MSAKVHPVIDIPSSDSEDDSVDTVYTTYATTSSTKTDSLNQFPSTVDTQSTTNTRSTVDTQSTVELPSSFDQPHLSSSVKCSLWFEIYRQSIICLGIAIVICVIIAVVFLRRSDSAPDTTSTNPCEGYKSDDFASSVSLTCFRYMWANTGCKSAVPDGYAGWYLRSPDGGKTVLCVAPKIGPLCGAGSYGAILNSIWRCDLEYKGY